MENLFAFIVGVIIISVVGTIFHFTYDWSHKNKILAIFSAVNESTWEHIKIALTATFLYSLIDGAMFGQNPNYFVAKLVSLLIIIFFIPIIFYGYTAISKRPILPIDILSFYVVIFASQIVAWWILSLPALPFAAIYVGTVGTTMIFGLYLLGTLMPVKNFLFKDPITKRYGLRGHSDVAEKPKSKK